MEFKRVTTNPRQMGGVARLRGLRIPVATIAALIAQGQTAPESLALYPDLEAEDIRTRWPVRLSRIFLSLSSPPRAMGLVAEWATLHTDAGLGGLTFS